MWNRLTNIGIWPETSARAAGFIRASNSTSVVVGIWLSTLVAATFSYFYPFAPDLVWANLGAVVLLFTAPVWKRFGWYRASDAVVALTCLALVTFNALHFGRESWNHLFLLAAVLIAFNYISDRILVAANTILGIGLFAFVEIWFATGRPSLLGTNLPQTILEWIKLASIYNLVVLTVGLAISNRVNVRKTQDLLEQERFRSESLLKNILPASIAETLKERPSTIAERFDEVSILFADIVGFTPMSRAMSAEEVVSMLNEVFTGFDRQAKALGLEKIKTIGDAYMVAGGVPDARPDHAAACLSMAKSMLEHMRQVRQRWPGLQLRIGIHSGPVVAGVIGESKFSYDLWGEAVNLASRMESHGVPGHIHVSDVFRAQFGTELAFEPRGKIEIKGHRPMQTYLLTVEVQN